MSLFQIIFIATLVTSALLLGLSFFFNRKPSFVEKDEKVVFLAGRYSPVLTFLTQGTIGIHIDKKDLYKALVLAAEFSAIFVWACFVGKSFLDFNPSHWPEGAEYPVSVRENYFWPKFLSCGACALWNGFSDGGYPALVDLQGAPLQPLVAIPTILFGVVNGSKVTLILSLALAGLVQWWIGKILELGRAARMWGALLAVVAGSLVGRMDNGLVTLVVSTATASLVIPAGIRLAQRPSNKTCVRFAIALALTAISGQGYLQLCTAFAILPALVILFAEKKDVWKKFLLSFGLAVLLAGIFVVPYLHNSNNWVKDVDPDLKSIQPLEYQLLNLVIRSPDFFRNDALGKLPYPYLYINYIGWIPLLLAGVGLRLIPREKFRLLAFFVIATLLVFLNSSMILPKLLFTPFNKDFLFGIRFGSLMVGLSAPLIIGLASWGLDLILARKDPILNLSSSGFNLTMRLWWILLPIPCLWAIASAYNFSQDWLYVIPKPVECSTIMDQIKSQPTQWVRISEGEHFWDICALDAGVKLAQTFHPWHWKDREIPKPGLVAVRPGSDDLTEPILFKNKDIILHSLPDNNYAEIAVGGKPLTSCASTANGGLIQVLCTADQAGQLTVREHAWPDWTVLVNDQPTGLIPGEWLQVNLPAGQNRITFRYQPWDIPVGLFVSLVGIFISIWMVSERAFIHSVQPRRKTL
jgi:hypothetical protein